MLVLVVLSNSVVSKDLLEGRWLSVQIFLVQLLWLVYLYGIR